MLYSSGTTGRPKAVKRPLPPAGEVLVNHRYAATMYRDRYGVTESSVYLSPAPLYHSAPLSSSLTIHRLGGTVVVMERFDAEQALALIDDRHVTHAQFVPTMFVRMLKLDPAIRAIVRRLQPALRDPRLGAVPGSRQAGDDRLVGADPRGVLLRYRGHGRDDDQQRRMAGAPRVGRSPDRLRDPHRRRRRRRVAAHATGRVFFESDRQFEYLNDPVKTASVRDDHGWRTLGDVGHLDDDGYLYLTDRSTFMIVSGGVNIYPQEVEDLLIAHPAVHDAAVFGVPERGVRRRGQGGRPAVRLRPRRPRPRAELIDFCRDNLAHYKAPRSIDFVTDLPRDPNGKLYKRQLREQYWGDRTSRIM